MKERMYGALPNSFRVVPRDQSEERSEPKIVLNALLEGCSLLLLFQALIVVFSGLDGISNHSFVPTWRVFV
jgi:hypothetical protein